MNWMARVPLFVWLAASAAAVVIVTVVTLTLLDIRSERANLDKHAANNAERMALVIESQVDDLVITGDVDGIRDAAKALDDADPSISFEVTDRDGRVMVQADAAKWAGIGRPTRQQMFSSGVTLMESGSIFVATIPVTAGTETFGTVRVLVDRAELQRDFTSIARERALTAAIVGALGVIGALAITYWLTAPINRVANVLRSLEKVDRETRLISTGPRESRRLIGSLNNVLPRLFDRDKERAKLSQEREHVQQTIREMVTPLNLAQTYAKAIREAKSSTVVHKQLDNLQVIHGQLEELVAELQSSSSQDESVSTREADIDATRRAGADTGARSSGGGG